MLFDRTVSKRLRLRDLEIRIRRPTDVRDGNGTRTNGYKSRSRNTLTNDYDPARAADVWDTKPTVQTRLTRG
jgi:hypothetical protein